MLMQELKDAYNNGRITKPDYIDRMHEIHAHIFEYTEFLKKTDIARIEITDNSVIMTSRTNGIQLIVDKEDKRIIPIEILNFDFYEKDNSEMILNLIDDGQRVFDIGGNIGWYSLTIAKNKKAEVYTFEPIPKTFNYLAKNIELNKLDNIRTFNFGFSNKEQELNFYYYPEGSGNASLANLSEQKNVEVITCRVKKLDEFIETNNLTVDFIKCDVEGAELFVFQGGLASLQKNRPIIFSELLRKWAAKFNYHPNEVITLFKKLGYRCFAASNGKLKEFFEMDAQTVENNFFFLHNEHHNSKIKKYAI